ncbi:MAG: NeuD/PglB/VioB family sugar acetyltransferase [Anaerolineales bacterium]
MSHPITIPLINPNEPEAFLAALHVAEGQHVRAGDLIATLETTKASHELTAEADGYLTGLRAAEGDTLRAGEVLAYLAESPRMADDGQPTTEDGRRTADNRPPTPDSALPEGLRITRPALALARERGLDLSSLPIGPLVTERTVRAALEQASAERLSPPDTPFDPTAIIIYGAGGHGKALYDLLRVLGGYRVLGFVDDGRPAGSEIMGLPVLGGKEVLPELHARGVRLAVNAVGGIGNVQVRVGVFRALAGAGFTCPALIHPTAFVEPGAHLEAGVQVMPHAYVGSEAHIGYGALVNTGAIVSHDCRLGAYVNLSPGATLAGDVTVGAGALIGMRATVNLGVTIGEGARIGNGATVKSDLPPRGVVPAGGIWPRA